MLRPGVASSIERKNPVESALKTVNPALGGAAAPDDAVTISTETAAKAKTPTTAPTVPARLLIDRSSRA